MDFWGTVLVLLRRWYIVVPASVLTFVVVGAVYVSRPILHSSYSVLLFTAPTSGVIQPVDSKNSYLTNPLLNFDQGLSNVAAILVQALRTPETSDQLGVRPRSDPSFQVTNGSSNPELLISGPLVVITAQSTSPGKAQDLVVRVVQRAQQELVNLQREVRAPLSTYIVLSEVVSPTTPQEQRGTRLRPVISVLALGCIASVAAAFAAESIMTRPGRRRRVQSALDERMAVGTVIDSGGIATAATRPAVVAARLPSGPAGLDGDRRV